MTEKTVFNIVFLIWGLISIYLCDQAGREVDRASVEPHSNLVYAVAFLFTWAALMLPMWIWGAVILYRNR